MDPKDFEDNSYFENFELVDKELIDYFGFDFEKNPGENNNIQNNGLELCSFNNFGFGNNGINFESYLGRFDTNNFDFQENNNAVPSLFQNESNQQKNEFASKIENPPGTQMNEALPVKRKRGRPKKNPEDKKEKYISTQRKYNVQNQKEMRLTTNPNKLEMVDYNLFLDRLKEKRGEEISHSVCFQRLSRVLKDHSEFFWVEKDDKEEYYLVYEPENVKEKFKEWEGINRDPFFSFFYYY